MSDNKYRAFQVTGFTGDVIIFADSISEAEDIFKSNYSHDHVMYVRDITDGLREQLDEILKGC